MVNWWNWLPKPVQDVLAKIPSPVVEFFSGFIAVALGVGSVWLFAQIPPALDVRTTGGFIVTGLFATIWSLLYEMLLDPNGFEWKDIREREYGIVFWTLAWVMIPRVWFHIQ